MPPAGKISLPGTEIEFVDEGGRRGGRDGRRGGGGEGTDRVEGEGGGDPAGVTGGVGASGRELSRFERQALERARQRQRDRLEAGEPQVNDDEQVTVGRCGGMSGPRPF